MIDFDVCFGALYGDGRKPFPWQRRLHDRFKAGDPPATVDIPTGLGKTSAMAAWLLARAASPTVANRLVYVVDRRTVVDQASEEATKLAHALSNDAALGSVRAGLGLAAKQELAVSTLRGQFLDNKAWLADPARPAIIVGTVDMIGSRLLFEGYGVSRKQRPIHAGLLGMDCLILLDEAHLVPPFQALLTAVETDRDDERPLTLSPVASPRGLRITSLSATGRTASADAIQLEANDWAIETVNRRVRAAKPLTMTPVKSAPTPADFARTAMELTDDGMRNVRVVLFATSREDAEKIAKELATTLGRAAKARGERGGGDADSRIELLVGARRVHERETARENLRKLGFLPGEQGSEALQASTFLIATSAGEVGVDLDADIMIADAVPYERMAQRLGRVNRRGDKNATAQVVVFEPQEPAKDDREARARATLDLLRALPRTDAGFDASPAALSALRAKLPHQVAEASSPAPLRPALTKPLVEAWSMTSLKTHTGRPEVAPWLRGWVDDEPQITVVFRRYLPVMADGTAPAALVEAYFEAAPIQMAERLETTNDKVVEWLMERIKPKRRKTAAPSEAVDTVIDEEIDGEPETDETASEAAQQDGEHDQTKDSADQAAAFISKTRVVALLLDRELAPTAVIRVPSPEAAIKPEENKRKFEDIKKRVANAADGSVLIAWSGLGGLSNGLLSAESDKRVQTADHDVAEDDTGRLIKAPFTINFSWKKPETEAPESAATVVLERDATGTAKAWLEMLSTKDDIASRDDEDRKAITREWQTLRDHQAHVIVRLEDILRALGPLVSEAERTALRLAAAYHDQGKAADRWQKAFRGSRPLTAQRKTGEPLLVGGPFAKSVCPQHNQQILSGYRHEFGSLFDDEAQSALDAVDAETADLARHLIAAHHGHARPVISTEGVDQVPPSRAAAEATAVALRFADLQARLGPWRLAWLEALLRAADVKASAAPTTEVHHG